MNGLCIAPAFDSGGSHPHDATGAFQPGARAFAAHYGLPAPTLIDNHATPAKREAELLAVLARTPGPLDVVALFCHGWRTGLQLGPSLATVDVLARALRGVGAAELTVCLYACDAGEDRREVGDATPVLGDDAAGAGDGSFADQLRDGLLALGAMPRVIAHATAGHAFRNPYVRVFGRDTTAGGEWLVVPGSPAWRPWVRALAGGDLWLRMPAMTREQILAELGVAPH